MGNLISFVTVVPSRKRTWTRKWQQIHRNVQWLQLKSTVEITKMHARCCKRKCAKSKPPSLSPPSSSSPSFVFNAFTYLGIIYRMDSPAAVPFYFAAVVCAPVHLFWGLEQPYIYLYIYNKLFFVSLLSNQFHVSSFFFSFFSRYGGGWHVLMGEGFGFEITNDHNSLLYMFFGGLTAVLVWKCN